MAPLFGRQDRKQAGQYKVQALQAQLRLSADHGAKPGAQDPPELVERGQQEHFLRGRVGRQGGQNRIGFIGQAKDHVQAHQTLGWKTLQERQAVKHMPQVDHQRGQSDAGVRRASHQHRNHHVLGRACVNNHAGQHGQPGGRTSLHKQEPEHRAQGDVAHGHRQGQGAQWQMRFGWTQGHLLISIDDLT